MKRVHMAVVLIAAIILYSCGAVMVIRRENGQLGAIVDSIKSAADDKKSAADNAIILKDEWEKYRKNMSFSVDDKTLSELDESIAKIGPYITDANDELEAELENISRRLEQIYVRELPYWYNVL